ncbi:hypothetical protein D3C84_726920 [compost metagenome]
MVTEDFRFARLVQGDDGVLVDVEGLPPLLVAEEDVGELVETTEVLEDLLTTQHFFQDDPTLAAITKAFGNRIFQ